MQLLFKTFFNISKNMCDISDITVGMADAVHYVIDIIYLRICWDHYESLRCLRSRIT